MTRQGRSTYLVSQSKRIWLWYRRLVYVSNTRVLRTAKLVKGIKLDDNKEYDPAKILVDLDDFNVYDNKKTRKQAKARAIITAL